MMHAVRKHTDCPWILLYIERWLKAQAKSIRRQIEERLRRCKLEAHPENTKIVCCKDDDRRGSHEHESFDFLGHTFRPRPSKNRRGKFFMNFTTRLPRRPELPFAVGGFSNKGLDDIARMLRANLSGWLSYYGRYYKSGMHPTFRAFDRRLVPWAQRKYRRYRHQRRATHWLRRIAKREPQLFPHWQLGVLP